MDELINGRHANAPNAGQPVGGQSKHAHQQHQHSCPILDVVVQLTGNPTQTEQPDHLQWAEQTADALKREAWKKKEQNRKTAWKT